MLNQLIPVALGNQFCVFLSSDGNLMIEDKNFNIVADYPAPSEMLQSFGLEPITEQVPAVRVS